MNLLALSITYVLSLSSFNAHAINLYQKVFSGSQNATNTYKAIFANNSVAGSQQLRDIFGNPGSEIEAECNVHEASYDADSFEPRRGDYNLTRNSEREDLIQEIKDGGREHIGFTTLNIGGETLDFLNDNLTLPDGAYVPLTFPEAQEIAQEWGCRIPSADQLRGIAKYAANSGNQYTAITRTPNNGTDTSNGTMIKVAYMALLAAMVGFGRIHLVVPMLAIQATTTTPTVFASSALKAPYSRKLSNFLHLSHPSILRR